MVPSEPSESKAPVLSERSESKEMRLIDVAVPVPALDALTYCVPDGMPDPPVGARVLVPLGKRALSQYAVGDQVDPDAEMRIAGTQVVGDQGARSIVHVNPV